MTDPAPTPALQPAVVRRWLTILHGDAPGLTHICSTGDWAGKAFADLDAATGYVRYLDGERREGIYVRVTTLQAALPPGQRGGAADSAALPALWADLDLAGPGHAETDLPPDEAAGRQVIADTGLPEPTLWIHSGGGLYPIWLLNQPHHITGDNADQAKTLTKQWQAVIEHAAASAGWRYGRGVGDLARVLRIPGTINRKEGLARPCRIISATAARYSVEQLQTALNAAIARIAPPASKESPLQDPDPDLGQIRNPGGVRSVDRPEDTTRPGEDLNTRATWAQILEPAGWRIHYTQDDVTYWTRPGKPTGISASTNALGTDRLHVFTTNGGALEGGESYSLFGAYAALHFGGDHTAAARALGRQGYGTPLPDPAQQQRELLAALLPDPPATPPPAVTAPASSAPSLFDTPASPPPEPATAPTSSPEVRSRVWAPEVDVTNDGAAGDWLRDTIGAARLAGYFGRDGGIVHTPREAEAGYQQLSSGEDDSDGPAQIRPVTAAQLAARVTFTYGVYRNVKRGDQYVKTQAVFPRDVARLAVDAPDLLPQLRPLRSVVHAPTFRPDGTLITAPGYDTSTRTLHLPELCLVVPQVPDRPAGGHLRQAVALLSEMVAGFPFISAHHRANYLGLLFTPILRVLVPPPYKLGLIEAHQPASGKSLLAKILRTIHGGVVRSEIPQDDAELAKQLAAILMVTTGPVITWDNVSGAVRSSTLAGLLTETTLSDRPLGVTDYRTFTNDRLWTITGNNMALGGDLSRRSLGVMIDPGVPQPEKRTGFAIPDLPQWVRQRRGELLHALLVLVRLWVLEGQPRTASTSDGYAGWIGSVRGILGVAGIDGEFDHNDTTRDGVGADDEEWRDFLAIIHKVMGDNPWTVKELLGYVGSDSLLDQAAISINDLPDELATKAARNGVGSISRSLGWWLRNRAGRWAGSYCVRAVAETDVKTWRVFTMEATS